MNNYYTTKQTPDKNKTAAASGGVGFTGLLQITFIVLKLCNIITWSWWLVMLPTIITFGLAILLITFAVIVAALAAKD